MNDMDKMLGDDDDIVMGGGVVLGSILVICDMILTVIAVILNLFLVISMRSSQVNKLAFFIIYSRGEGTDFNASDCSII